MTDNTSFGVSRPHGSWIQTERAAHEEWARFLSLPGAAAASRVLHLILARMTKGNVYIISQGAMAEALGVDDRTIRRGVAMLKEHDWIDVANIGGAKSGVRAYMVKSRLAWQGSREGRRYAEIDARVHISEAEQEYNLEANRRPLRDIPTIYNGEQQLPVGDGLPPVSQPFLGGMEPDIPARRIEREPNFQREEFSAREIRELKSRKIEE